MALCAAAARRRSPLSFFFRMKKWANTDETFAALHANPSSVISRTGLATHSDQTTRKTRFRNRPVNRRASLAITARRLKISQNTLLRRSTLLTRENQRGARHSEISSSEMDDIDFANMTESEFRAHFEGKGEKFPKIADRTREADGQAMENSRARSC